MPRIDPTLIVVIVAVVLAVFAVRLLFRPREPPTATFKCARCGIVARHSERTAEAWRRKISRLYCDACHRKWLEAHPRQSDTTTLGSGASRQGCLGVLLLAVCVPIAVVMVALYA